MTRTLKLNTAPSLEIDDRHAHVPNFLQSEDRSARSYLFENRSKKETSEVFIKINTYTTPTSEDWSDITEVSEHDIFGR